MSVLAASLARALDPVKLAERAGITPDPWQARVLRSEARQLHLNCCRQAGKSTTTALLAADEVLHRAPALVLLLAPALRQAQELYRKITDTFDALGPEITGGIDRETALTLELENGSRVVTLPGNEAKVRGFSAASLVIVDEAARVPDPLYMAVRPMLAVSSGRIAMLSTPWGKRGAFYQEAITPDAEWERITVTAYDCPRIDRAWLEQERKQIGEWWFRQEYLCEFVDSTDQVFAHDLVMRALSDDLDPLFAEGFA